jgi:proteasome lid subunit RPN8/RPN11
MKLSSATLSDFEDHVLQHYPREACGLIVDGNYIPCPNSSSDPLQTFRIDPLHYVKAAALGEVQAVLHSHPYLSNESGRWPAEWPTTTDMTSWMKGNIPWGICSTDGDGISQLVWLEEHTQPLEGREFIHGIHDCYSIIRDWYKQERNVVLPNFARGIEWWHTGKDLYDENFTNAGFVTIDHKDAVIGDCVMMKVASKVTNHAAVITGPNQILHHMFNRLSGQDTLNKWQRCIVRTVRYVGPKEC